MAGSNNNLVFESDEIMRWKKAYKECKKYKSKIIKDKYDEYFKDIKVQYEINLKYQNTVELKKLTFFFRFVAKRSEIYLNLSKEERSSYKFDARNKAVRNLMEISSELEGDLEMMKLKAVNENPESYATIDSALVNIDTKIDSCLYYYVQDITYLSNYKLLKNTTLRLYVVIVGNSTGPLNLNRFSSEFSFSRYDFYDVNGVFKKNYRDENFRKRKIFRACEVPIVNKFNVAVPGILGKVLGGAGKIVVGNIEIEVMVYISPNDWVASRALESTTVGDRKLGDYLIDGDKVKFKGPLLTRSEI